VISRHCNNSRSLSSCTCTVEHRILRYIFNRRWKASEEVNMALRNTGDSECMQRVPIVVSWYFHPLLFFTIIASDMRMPFVTGKRDSLYACTRTDVLVFPLVSLFRDVRSSVYVQPALIKNERHFFSYYVNGINVIVSFLIVTSSLSSYILCEIVHM